MSNFQMSNHRVVVFHASILIWQGGVAGAIYFLEQLLQELGALVGAQFTLQFFKGEGHDVIVVGPGEPGIAGDVEPELVHEFDILRAQARSMRSNDILANRAVGGADLQAQAGTGLGHAFPGVASKLGLLVSGELVGEAADHARGIEALRGHHDGFEYIGRRNHEKGNGLAFFFCDGHGGGEEFLLVVIEDLACLHDGAATEARLAMVEASAHYDYILLGSIGMGEHLAQVVKIAGVAHRNKNISGADAHGSAAEFLIAVDAELIELFRLAVPFFRHMALGEGKDGEKGGAENDSGDGGLVLGKQVDDGGEQQHRGNADQSYGDFGFAEVEVAGDFPGAVTGLGEAQHEHREGLHGEAPDHAKGVERGQHVDVAAAQDDGEDLEAYDQVDDAVAGTEAVVRLLKPAGEHAVFGYSIQNAVGAHNGSILRTGQNQHSHQHDEAVKEQLQTRRSDQIHGNAADEVGEIVRANLVGNDHHGEKRDQRREEQAVDENDEPGLLQVLQLGMFDFAVDLGQSLFAAHGKDGVAEADEEDDPGDVAEPGREPAQRVFVQRNHARVQRAGRQLDGSTQHRDGAPDDQNHHHYGGDDHDLQSFLAGLVHALRVLPPEIKSHDDGQAGGKSIVGKIEGPVEVEAHVFDEAGEVLAGGDGADGAGEHVVEEQGRDGKLGQGAAHGFLDDAVDAAADEHAAGFDIKRPHAIAEQHDRENEPGSAPADYVLCIAASVVSGGCEVGKDDGGSPPEGDEGQHHRGGDEDFYGGF